MTVSSPNIHSELLDSRELIFDPKHEFTLKSQSPKAIGERRLAAVLCADVAGFARLVEENEEGNDRRVVLMLA